MWIRNQNFCAGRVLEEYVREEELSNIRGLEHTHGWANYRCRIDRVLTRGRGRPWLFEEGLECNSDRTMVAAPVELAAAVIERLEIDWDKVGKWVEKGGEGTGIEAECNGVGEVLGATQIK